MACCIVNVYAPCNRIGKRILWDKILLILNQIGVLNICILGDFNSVVEEEERKGAGVARGANGGDIYEFKEFINHGSLLDLKLQGWRYTWYSASGSCKSRIDRALVNDKWMEAWPGTILHGHHRSVLDHCTIVLDPVKADWGPKPFRFVNAWLEHPDFSNLVKESWEEGCIVGCGSFVFKAKLKRLRGVLCRWNIDVFGHLGRKVEDLKRELHDLDRKDDISGLSEVESVRRKEILAKILVVSKDRKSLLQQKARLNWLHQGDVNSAFFHKAIVRRRNLNGLVGLEIGDDWVESPACVKKEVFRHFHDHFQKRNYTRISMPSDLLPGSLEMDDREGLCREIPLDELKEAV
ncbi:hypothetical protein OROHE_006500 [Orobanche hederae]